MKEKQELTPAQQRLQKKKIQNRIRRVIQLLFFIFLPSLFNEAFSGVKGIFRQVGAGELLSWNAFLKTFVLLGVITIIFGRFFCGYACAFGSLGDAVYGFRMWLQKKTKKRFPSIPEKAALFLQNMKYIGLVIILATCVFGISGIIETNSPWAAFSRLRMFDFKISGYWISFCIFVLILIGMFFEERFFCQFLCPLGAIFSLLPILPWAVKKRNKENCIPKCNACQKQCPVHRKVDGIQVHSNECIQCGRCKNVCPKGNIYQVSSK